MLLVKLFILHQNQWKVCFHVIFLKRATNIVDLLRFLYCSTVYKTPVAGLRWPGGFREVNAPRFLDNGQSILVRFSALRTGRIYPQEIFLVLISRHIIRTAIYLLLNNWKFLISLKHTTEDCKTNIVILWFSKLWLREAYYMFVGEPNTITWA
jgi:hypothetical protein